MHVQQPHPDGEGPPSGARRHHARVLRDQVADGVLLHPLRVRRRLPHAAGGDRRAATPPGCSARTSSAAASTSTSILHRGAGAYICGEETGPDREPRRQAGVAADQAAVPRRRGGVPQADHRQQRRDAGLRHADHAARHRLVQVASACRPTRRTRATPAATARSCTPSPGTSTKPMLRRAADGRHHPRTGREARRRRVEGPQGEGRQPRRAEHGLRRRATRSSRTAT